MRSDNLKSWLREIDKLEFEKQSDVRMQNYISDLEDGLAIIRSYPQGVSIFGSARSHKYSKWAEHLGRLLAEHNHPVITGGGPGIMESANRGAFNAGGRSIGLNIKLPHEQHINPYLTDTLEFRYFFARKVMLTFSAKVFVFFPGGFGTMDEFVEILLLMQEGKMPRMPLFLIGKTFWQPLDHWYRDYMEPEGLIAKGDRAIYTITENIEQVVAAADLIGHPPIHVNLYEGFSK